MHRDRGCGSGSCGLEELVMRLLMLLLRAVVERMAVVRGRRCRRLRRRMMDVMRVILLVMVSSGAMGKSYSTCWREARRMVNRGSWGNGTR
jgi:hypothetical protein